MHSCATCAHCTAVVFHDVNQSDTMTIFEHPIPTPFITSQLSHLQRLLYLTIKNVIIQSPVSPSIWCVGVHPCLMCEQIFDSSFQQANVCGSQCEWVTYNGTSCTCHVNNSFSVKVSAIYLSPCVLGKMTPVREMWQARVLCVRAYVCLHSAHCWPHRLQC